MNTLKKKERGRGKAQRVRDGFLGREVSLGSMLGAESQMKGRHDARKSPWKGRIDLILQPCWLGFSDED